MRDDTHMEQIERWAKFVRENDISVWKKIHTEFIDALFEKNERFLRELAKTKEGKEKIIKIYRIKNVKCCKELLE